LVMSTLNSSRTGQGVVHLSRNFFKNYALLRRGSPDTILRCNVSNKKFYNIIKKSIMGGKQIKQCQLNVRQGNIDAAHHTESRINMRIQYHNGVTKKHTLWYSNGDPVVMFCKSQYESRITCPPLLIKDFLARFDHKTQDIEFTCTDQGLILKTHPENRTVSTGDPPVRSMFVIYKQDFDTFDIKKRVKLVVNLKELKSFVDYIEYLGGTLELQYEDAGMPLLNKYTLENTVVSYMALQTVPPHMYDTQADTEISFVDTSELDYTATPSSRGPTPAPSTRHPSASTSNHPNHASSRTEPSHQQQRSTSHQSYQQQSATSHQGYQQQSSTSHGHRQQSSIPQQASTSSNTHTHYIHDSPTPSDSLPSTIPVRSQDPEDEEPLFTGRLVQRRATRIRDADDSSAENAVLISSSSTSRGSLDKTQRLERLEELREQRTQRQARYS
ncbi:hypothetical protein MBANPS3_009780, partial [Mucor bainieri]